MKVDVRFDKGAVYIGVSWKREPLHSAERKEDGTPDFFLSGWLWTVKICLVPLLPIRLRWKTEVNDRGR